jgi:hypothetical protein
MKKVMVNLGEEKITPREIEIGLKIQSPFLVPTYDTFVEEWERINMMPYYEKGSLHQAFSSFQSDPIQLREVVCLFPFWTFLLDWSYIILCICVDIRKSGMLQVKF